MQLKTKHTFTQVRFQRYHAHIQSHFPDLMCVIQNNLK